MPEAVASLGREKRARWSALRPVPWTSRIVVCPRLRRRGETAEIAAGSAGATLVAAGGCVGGGGVSCTAGASVGGGIGTAAIVGGGSVVGLARMKRGPSVDGVGSALGRAEGDSRGEGEGRVRPPVTISGASGEGSALGRPWGKVVVGAIRGEAMGVASVLGFLKNQ